MATIVGRVIDSETRLPIPFIAVDLFKLGAKIADTHTDKEGKFYFFDVPPGEYTVVMLSPIHNPVRHPLRIEPDDEEVKLEIKTVKIRL